MTDENDHCINKYQYNESVLCPPKWDEVYCWPPSQPNTTVMIRCTEIFAVTIGQTSHQTPDNYFAYRKCSESGKWEWNNWTNYTECLNLLKIEEQTLQSSHIEEILSYIVLICSICSMITLIMSLVIFTSLRCLDNVRIRVHKNLCVALLLHCFILIIMSSPVVLDDNDTPRLPQINWLCKALKWCGIYSSMTTINWMFLEGFLLHTRLHLSPFNANVWHQSSYFYYLIGWIIPAFFVGIWSIVYELTQSVPCWMGYGRSKTIWIVTAPMMIALTINFVFLINIIRILIVKLRHDSCDQMTFKAIRATAVLIPLLGIEHLLFCINPSHSNQQLESVYLIINGLTQSIQGMTVTILYCFTNTEIRTALSNAMSRRRMSHSINERVNDGKRKCKESSSVNTHLIL